MRPTDTGREEEEIFVIPARHFYMQNILLKIAEDEIKPVNESGEIVLSRVVVPEYIVVHDGSPRDSTAKNYYVKYKDYIKNVASSKIYAHLAPQIRFGQTFASLCLLRSIAFIPNGIETKGMIFTITSSTAFDHKWIPEMYMKAFP